MLWSPLFKRVIEQFLEFRTISTTLDKFLFFNQFGSFNPVLLFLQKLDQNHTNSKILPYRLVLMRASGQGFLGPGPIKKY